MHSNSFSFCEYTLVASDVSEELKEFTACDLAISVDIELLKGLFESILVPFFGVRVLFFHRLVKVFGDGQALRFFEET